MELLHYPLAFIALLGALVTIHEFGHYIVARWSGVQVVKFSVGFGRAIWSRVDKHGTEFAIAMIPIGGYVRMLDDRDPDQQHLLDPSKRVFMDLNPWWRIAIALGGPLANFLLAIVVYWVLFVAGSLHPAPMVQTPAAESTAAQAGIEQPVQLLAVDGAPVSRWADVGMSLANRLGDTGQIELTVRNLQGNETRNVALSIERWHQGVAEPDLIGSLGLVPTRMSVVGEVVAGSPAEQAGLQTDDWVVAVDGRPVADWAAWVAEIEQHPGTTITLTYYRNGQRLRTEATPRARELEDGTVVGQLGVGQSVIHTRYGALDALSQGLAETWDTTVMTLNILGKMVTGQVSVKNLSGPLSIAQVAGDSARSGWQVFLGIMALLSISLGVLNLLPIPILDGGHVVFHSVELLTGKPVSERVQALGVQVGLFLVGGLMILATYNDLLRLF